MLFFFLVSGGHTFIAESLADICTIASATITSKIEAKVVLSSKHLNKCLRLAEVKDLTEKKRKIRLFYVPGKKQQFTLTLLFYIL